MPPAAAVPGKWYVQFDAEPYALMCRSGGPFDSEDEAREWLLSLPLIKGASVWQCPPGQWWPPPVKSRELTWPSTSD